MRQAHRPPNGGCGRLPARTGVDRIHCDTTALGKRAFPTRVIISGDGGKSFKVTAKRVPDMYTPKHHAGRRTHALAVDPQNPQIVYLGIDGDPATARAARYLQVQDGGATWKQLPQQPAAGALFYGLSVDPTNSQRVFWAAAARMVVCAQRRRSARGSASSPTRNVALHVMVTQGWHRLLPAESVAQHRSRKNMAKLYDFNEGTILAWRPTHATTTLWISVTT
jgi:hypothetical protein